MSAALDCDIAVVGGGLVGAAAALGLHRLGMRVRLLERATAPEAGEDEYDLRVYAIVPASLRLLEDLGVWCGIAAERSCAYTHTQVWETEPESALHFDAADARTDVLGHIVESRVIQRHLWQALPTEVLCAGTGVERLDVDDASATLQLSDGSALRCALVVAADSARSPLREAQGIETLRAPYEQTAVVCHVRTERAHGGTAYQRFLETGPLALLPLADGRSSIVWSSTEADALMALDDESFCAALTAASQQVLGVVQGCTRRLTFPLALQHAQDYVRPRFALIGDAAHVVHPLAGQGVNLGFGDVRALLDLLGEAQRKRRDPGGLRLLQRYQRARRAEVREMIAVTDGLYRAYRLQMPGWDWLRRTGLVAVNTIAPLRRSLVRRACGIE